MAIATLRKLQRGILALIVAAASLSGCVEQPLESAAVAAEPKGVADANFGNGGNIFGLVADEELSPIEGALVALEGNVSVTTDAGGQFRLLNIAPGEHRIIVQALGHQSVARQVTVEAGATMEVAFTLERIPIAEPYYDFFAKVGFACLQTYTAGVRLTFGNLACPNPPASVLVQFQATRGVETIVSEMVWQQTSALSARILGIDLWQGGVRTGVWTCDYCYGSAQGPSPVILRVDGAFEGINGEEAEDTSTIDNIVILRGDPTFAGQVGLIYSQKVDVYTSVFYGASAPDGYTGLPDA